MSHETHNHKLTDLEVRSSNDCVIRAIRDATGIPYDEVHAAVVKRHGLPVGVPTQRGFFPHYYRQAMKDLGVRFRRLGYSELRDMFPDLIGGKSYPTVANFVRNTNFDCPILIGLRGHLLAASKGVLNDYTGVRSRVQSVYVLTGLPCPSFPGRNANKAQPRAARTLERARQRVKISDEDLRAWCREYYADMKHGLPQKDQWTSSVSSGWEVNVGEVLASFKRERPGVALGWKRMYVTLRAVAVELDPLNRGRFRWDLE